MTSRSSLWLFLTAEALSLFGNAAIGIVLPWLVLSRTGDASVTGLVAAASGIPSVAAALVGGWLIDRVGRRRMSVLADLGSAVAVAGLAVVDHLTGLTVAWFVVLGVLGAVFDVPGMTARETLMANVATAGGVPLDKVAGYRQAVFGVSFLAGPALAGTLLAVLDPIRVVWLTAACSALAALATLAMRLAPAPAPAQDDDSPRSGWAVVRRSPALVAVIVLSFASALVVAPLLAVVLPAHFQGLGAPEQLGLATSAFAIGSMVGAVLYAVALSGRRWLTWVLSIALFTGSFLLIAPLVGFWLVAAGMAAAGIGSGLMGPISMVAMTEHVHDAVRGRVFGLLNALALVASPLGLGLMAVLLRFQPLEAAGWAMLVAWIPAAAYGILAPGLRAFVLPPATPEGETTHADDRAAR